MACAIATHAAAPTIIDETIDAVSPRPLLMTIRIVTAIRVIPLSGDQFVLPMHSDKITPATHIQAVPSRAISPPRMMPISFTEVMEMAKSKSVAPAMPM